MDQQEIINAKLDLIFSLVASLPIFIKAPHERKMKESWRDAQVDYREILDKYRELIEYEHNSNTTGVEDKVS